MNRRQLLIAAVAVAIPLALLLLYLQRQQPIDWNSTAVQWYHYEAGLQAAAAQDKNIVLIVYADWCPTCKQFSRMFHDPQVVDASDNVILIRLDQDRDTQYLEQYSLDGDYVPRTYIIDRNREIMTSPYRSSRYEFFLPPGNTEYLANLLRELK